MASGPFDPRSCLQFVTEREKRLFVVDAISTVVSRSLTMKELTNSAVDKVAQIMDVDTILLFVLEKGENRLKAYRGVSKRAVQRASMDGWIFQTEEPLFVGDSQSGSKLLREIVVQEGLRSLLIVPLKTGDKVVGTLSVAKRRSRYFTPEENELAGLIGIILGAAVEKAGLCHESALATLGLQELFEMASDAIWIHDLEGNIVDANQATARIIGLDLDECIGSNVLQLLSPSGLKLAREIKRKLLSGESINQPYEQRLIRKDGGETIIMVTTNLLGDGDKVRGFHHIGRDITLERQLQDQLRLYITQITNAHEDERNRISRELHDDTIQALIAISRNLENSISKGKGNNVPIETKDFLKNLKVDVDSILVRMRRIIEDLRPVTLQYLGLLPALRELVTQLRSELGCTAKFNIEGTELSFDQHEELAIFRIVQEALKNIWKHSEATSVDVNVQFSDGGTYITINDNGKGFEEKENIYFIKKGKLGIAGMMERSCLIGASLVIDSKIGSGTTLTLNIPQDNIPARVTDQPLSEPLR